MWEEVLRLLRLLRKPLKAAEREAGESERLVMELSFAEKQFGRGGAAEFTEATTRSSERAVAKLAELRASMEAALERVKAAEAAASSGGTVPHVFHPWKEMGGGFVLQTPTEYLQVARDPVVGGWNWMLYRLAPSGVQTLAASGPAATVEAAKVAALSASTTFGR